MLSEQSISSSLFSKRYNHSLEMGIESKDSEIFRIVCQNDMQIFLKNGNLLRVCIWWDKCF